MATNRVNQLLGKYRLMEFLGRGGFAEVYLGEHQHLKSYAALKVLHVILTKEMADAFLLEAQTLAQLIHANIVRVLDYDTQQGTPFIVMEYVPGGTLRNHIPGGTRLPISTVVFYVKQVASALQFAHSRSVIHRDVKPDNMLLATEQHILLSDFGLALFAPNQLSTQPEMEGTILYSAPEQLHGKPVFASDQYSLGIVTYEWLCGVRPFEGGGPIQVAAQHLFSVPRPPREIRPDLSEAVEAVVLKALAKEPQQRYPDVQSFARALEQASQHNTLAEEDLEITSPRQAIVASTARSQGFSPALQRAVFARVFLSYPPSDEDFAKRLRGELSKQGVFFTNDHIFGPADPHDPEQIMQQAIRAAHVVLIVDSKASRSSRTVKEHLRIATTYQKRLAYIWISGPGLASMPSGFSGPQPEVIDARQNRYPKALDDIIAYLNKGNVTDQMAATQQAGGEIRNPYKGLRAFTMDDAGDFFGREKLIDNLARRVQTLATEQPRKAGNRLLALIGPSGSGKSSTMMAGLLPQLRQDIIPGSKQWIYLEPMKPGPHPGEALAITLSQHLPHLGPRSIYTDLGEESARALHLFCVLLARQARLLDPLNQPRVILVIDQFEEVFSSAVSERERQHFLNLLTTAVTEPDGPVVVLLTLRADFYGHTMQYTDLSHLIEKNHVPVAPMDQDDLRAIIERPAALPDVQMSFEGNLVGDLLFEAQGQIGTLPLLEFTLDQLFQLRQGNMLTLPAYKQIGGVKGALVKCAEAVYAQLPNEEYRTLTRALFLRLIDPGPTSQDATRRRAELAELALTDEKQRTIIAAVADAFVAARLLVVNEQGGERTIEVSHEALIAHWPRLFIWLREARADIIHQHTIGNDTREWLRRGKPKDRLYSGSELSEAQAWEKRNFPNQDEAEFLRASATEQNRRENEELMRQQEQIKMQQEQIKLRDNITKHQRRLLSVLSIFTIVVIILGLLAQINYTNANTAVQQNASRALAANASIALSNHKTDLALLLSIKAYQESDTLEARNSLFTALMQSPHLAGILDNGYNYPTQRPLGDISSLAFDKTGQTLAAYNSGSQITRWNVQTHIPKTIDLPPTTNTTNGTSSTFAFSKDNSTAGIINVNGTWLVDLQTKRTRSLPSAPIPPPDTQNMAITFSHDGSLVAASRCYVAHPTCAENYIFIWQTQTTLRTLSLSETNTDVFALALSPDDKMLAIATSTDILIVSAVTGEQIAALPIKNTILVQLAFSPDGSKLAATNEDLAIHLWETKNWTPLPLFIGHKDTIFNITFNHHGDTLASASKDGSILLWDVNTGQPLGPPLTGHPDQIYSLAFSFDDTMLASGGKDGSIMLWDVNAEGPINRQLHDPSSGTQQSIVFSHDGKTLFVEADDGTIFSLESSTGKLQTTFGDLAAYPEPQSYGPPHPTIALLAVSYNGKRLAAARADGSIFVWDVPTKTVLAHFPVKYSGQITKIQLSDEGNLLAAGGDGRNITVWDVDKPSTTFKFAVKASSLGTPMALNGDGTLLAAGSCTTSQEGCQQSEVLLWAVKTGQLITRFAPRIKGNILDVTFTHDGSMVAASGSDGITLWDVTKPASATASLVVDNVPTDDPTLFYRKLLFSPNGKLLLSYSQFGHPFAFVIWDVLLKEQVVQPFSETPQQGSLAFSPDSQHLISVFTRDNEKNILLLWDIDPAAWQKIGCELAHRNLIGGEWDQFVKGEQPPKQICTHFPLGS